MQTATEKHFLTPEQLKELDANGFLLVKNVLAPEDVMRLRDIAIDFFTNHEDQVIFIFCGKTKSNAFNALPELGFVLKNPKVVGIMKDVAGENVKYAHHSDAHYNMISGWHKDNYGDDDWSVGPNGETYKCYKMAFYLQDHDKDNQGLSVRKGSHKSRKLEEGAIVDIPSKAGDAVIFDMRISHVGKEAGIVEKAVMVLTKNNKTRFRFLHAYRKMMGIQDKLSIFFAFGEPNAFTEEHIVKTIARQNKQNKETGYAINEQIRKTLDEVGVGY